MIIKTDHELTMESLLQAIGLATTLSPDMIMDVDDPIGMMQRVVKEVNKDREELAQLRAKIIQPGWNAEEAQLRAKIIQPTWSVTDNTTTTEQAGSWTFTNNSSNFVTIDVEAFMRP